MNPQAHWQRSLANVITDPQVLLSMLELEHCFKHELAISNQFPLRVPHEFVARMQKGDINDPLLRQVLPLNAENIPAPDYEDDPLHELAVNPIPGLLHKYHTRVLLTLAGACAINCRYCFRRHFPYEQNIAGGENWKTILDYIAADPSITEVIYSGGEPLLVKDAQLAKLTASLAAIPHVRRLRIHTRLPIVIPSRVNDELIAWLTTSRLQIIMVLHCNHANEIDAKIQQAMQALRDNNIILLNQAVLLKGVNDSVEALVALSEALFATGILPYYLHGLDRTQGTQHFEVSEKKARILWRAVNERLPGYLVPKLVREQAGALAKMTVVE